MKLEASQLPIDIAGVRLQRLRQYLATDGRRFVVHDLGNQTGIDYGDAYAVALLLIGSDAVKATWLVYHTCGVGVIDTRAFSEGFVRQPFICDECEETVDPDDLLYDLHCELQATVVIE